MLQVRQAKGCRSVVCESGDQLQAVTELCRFSRMVVQRCEQSAPAGQRGE